MKYFTCLSLGNFYHDRNVEGKCETSREGGTIIKLSAIQSFPCRFILFTIWLRHALGPKQFVNYELLNSFFLSYSLFCLRFKVNVAFAKS